MTKASDNAFPSILITEGTEPSAPAAGKQRLYIDSTTHVLMLTNSSGTESAVAGAPTTLDYLVGTATGSLSGEIVAGTTPGGELGGTWASPTVDEVHAGQTAWASYTPTWAGTTGISLGDGTLSGRWRKMGPKTYAVQISLTWGSTTSVSGTGDWTFLLPDSMTSGSVAQVMTAFILDSGTDRKLATGFVTNGATVVGPIVPEGGNTVTKTVPQTWANGDNLTISGILEAA